MRSYDEAIEHKAVKWLDTTLLFTFVLVSMYTTFIFQRRKITMSLFLRLFAEPKPPHDLIRSNPRLGTMRSGRAIFLLMTAFFFVLFLLLILFFIVNDIVTSGSSPFPWYFLFLPLTMLLNVGVFSLQIHYWKRVEPWRFVAALGDERLLADEQPEPNPDPLHMPVTIKITPVIERRFSIGSGFFFIFALIVYIS